MSELKQSRIKRKKNLRGRGWTKGMSSKRFTFPRDRYQALEEIRIILGFSQTELRNFLSLLEKSEGYLRFPIGNINVEFHTQAIYKSLSSEIIVEITVKQKQMEHTARYEFRNHAPDNHTPIEY